MSQTQSQHPSASGAHVLRAPPRRHARPPGPCAMVIFGAAGDLTKRLLVPALYNLSRTGLIPAQFAILGVDLAQHSTQDWTGSLHDMLQSFVGNPDSESDIDKLDPDAWHRISTAMEYVQGDITQDAVYQTLRTKLDEVAHQHGTGGSGCAPR